MNIELTNFIIANPKFEFIRPCLYKLKEINSIVPIYKNKNDYFFYIGKNETEYLFLYGTFSKVVYNKMVIMFSAWYKNIKFENNNLILSNIIYKKIDYSITDYIILKDQII